MLLCHPIPGRQTMPLSYSSWVSCAKEKETPVLLDACRILVERGASIRCVVVGEGPQKRMLERLVEQYALQKIVDMPGAILQEDLRAYLERADVFVLPCVTASNGDLDGVPVSLIEAMAMEIATVSTHVSGIPELIEDTVSGLLVPEKDAVALADALQSVLEDGELRSRLGRNARQKVIREFDIDKSAAQLAALFQEYARTN